MDVTDLDEAQSRFNALADQMGGIDLVILSAGTGYTDEAASWPHVRETIETNALGFAALADAALAMLADRDQLAAMRRNARRGLTAVADHAPGL